MLDLDSIVFKVDTAELDAAALKIDKLATNMSKLVKPVQQAEIDSSKLAEAKAKEAKAISQAAEAAAKAEKAQSGLVKATKEAGESAKVSMNALEKQTQILENMTLGFSRGQSTVLTYAKAAGLATESLEELKKVLLTQRELVGGDPFDKSTSGLLELNQRMREGVTANQLYSNGIELTQKQTAALSRDLERLSLAMQHQGKSADEVLKAQQQYRDLYVETATQVNTLTAAEKNKIKSSREAINANAALAKEDQRLISMLETMNLTQNQGSVATDKAANSIEDMPRC